jgi:hypothetical protein
MIKKLLIIPFILLVGCTIPEIPFPEVMDKDDIFSVKESAVTNAQSIHFKLLSSGIHTLTLINNSNNQVVTRERFVGQKGENIKKIYTNSLPKGYLLLVLEDINKNQIGKTTIINN